MISRSPGARRFPRVVRASAFRPVPSGINKSAVGRWNMAWDSRWRSIVAAAGPTQGYGMLSSAHGHSAIPDPPRVVRLDRRPAGWWPSALSCVHGCPTHHDPPEPDAAAAPTPSPPRRRPARAHRRRRSPQRRAALEPDLKYDNRGTHRRAGSSSNVAAQGFPATRLPAGLNIEANRDRWDMQVPLACSRPGPRRPGSAPSTARCTRRASLRAAANSGGVLTILRTRKMSTNISPAGSTIPKSRGFLGTKDCTAWSRIETCAASSTRVPHDGPNPFLRQRPRRFRARHGAHGNHRVPTAVVENMEAFQIIVDLAHASPRLMDDILTWPPAPSSFRTPACGAPRQQPQSQRRANAPHRRHGWPHRHRLLGWPCGEDVASIIRAIWYTADLVGVDHRAGIRFDGRLRTFDSSGMALLTEGLLADGFSEDQIARIMGGNVMRLLRTLLPSRGDLVPTSSVTQRRWIDGVSLSAYNPTQRTSSRVVSHARLQLRILRTLRSSRPLRDQPPHRGGTYGGPRPVLLVGPPAAERPSAVGHRARVRAGARAPPASRWSWLRVPDKAAPSCEPKPIQQGKPAILLVDDLQGSRTTPRRWRRWCAPFSTTATRSSSPVLSIPTESPAWRGIPVPVAGMGAPSTVSPRRAEAVPALQTGSASPTSGAVEPAPPRAGRLERELRAQDDLRRESEELRARLATQAEEERLNRSPPPPALDARRRGGGDRAGQPGRPRSPIRPGGVLGAAQRARWKPRRRRAVAHGGRSPNPPPSGRGRPGRILLDEAHGALGRARSARHRRAASRP